jgi:hypothetical protein
LAEKLEKGASTEISMLAVFKPRCPNLRAGVSSLELEMELSRRMELMLPHRLGAFASRGDLHRRDTMGLILLLVILVLLFGGGGFYMGPPFHYYGGGLGAILVIVIIVLLLRG